MKRAAFLRPISILAVMTAGCAAVPSSNYVQVTEAPAFCSLENESYRFSIAPVSSQFKDAPWRIYREKDEPRNTLLMGGMPGHSYSVSVQVRSTRDASPSQFIQLTEIHHKGVQFRHSPHNPLCVTSELPRAHASGAIMLMAICTNPKTRETFELAYWEKASNLESASSGLKEAMKTLVSSFKFK